MTAQDTPQLFKQFIRIITFIDLPINRKFSLFAVGVLFWLLTLAGVTSFALITIDQKYSRIVTQTIPHERVAQKIARNLHAILIEAGGIKTAATSVELERHGELARNYLEDIRSYGSALALGGSVTDLTLDGEGATESFQTASVNDSPEGIAYLRELTPQLEEIGKSLALFIDDRNAVLVDPARQEGVERHYDALKGELDKANRTTQRFLGHTSTLYNRYTAGIKETIHYTVVAMAAVLLISLILLGVFTHWIADAIALPIRSIITQIHALRTGDIDLRQKIAISSKDEIGTLSCEFNELMESVYGMTNFKNVIEEDTSLVEIYGRLGEVFERVAGIPDFCIYEIRDNQREMVAAFPLGLTEAELRCKAEILGNCELCRARKTGHAISSLAYPGVCLQFKPDAPEQQHICLPVNVGGRLGGVVQFLFTPGAGGELDQHEVHARLHKAESYLKQSQSVLEAKRLLHTLRESALKDALTGLYNRRFLQDHSQQIITGAKRRQENIGLLMCDLDFFKQVNDKYGHETGDLLLRETSAILARSIRESDYVIRFGGEEFLIVLLAVKDGDAELVAEKIRSAVAAAKIRTPSGTISKTISIGVSIFPADTDAFWQAIKFADVALYRAKETGRNKVVRFTADMWSGDSF